MRSIERVLVLCGVGAALVMSSAAYWNSRGGSAERAGQRPSDGLLLGGLHALPRSIPVEPAGGEKGDGADGAGVAAVQIGTCDIYLVTQKLMESDRFKPLIEEEQNRRKAELEPAAKELNDLRAKLQGADPNDPEAQKTFQEFQQKQQLFNQAAQKSEAEYQVFFSQKYVEAYELARSSVDGVAQTRGFTHVLAARREEVSKDVQSVGAVRDAFLARPIIKAPEGSDITDDVLKDLKLDA